MHHQLPERPNAAHLRKQAKDLLKSARAREPEALARIAEHLPAIRGQSAIATLALHDAQSVIAREHGFPSWAKLLDEVEARLAALGEITPEVEEAFVSATLHGRAERFATLLRRFPCLPEVSPAAAWVSGMIGPIDPGAVDAEFGPNGWTALAYVSFSLAGRIDPERRPGLTEATRRLLAAGADPNRPRTLAETPPLRPLYGVTGVDEDPERARLLLQAGANPNDGESIPHAASLNHRAALAILAEFGADLGARQTTWSNTPLYFLTGYRDGQLGEPAATEGARWLLEHGADPNVRSYAGETALHGAARTGRGRAFLELLVKHGVELDARTDEGLSAYALASIAGHTATAQALAELGASVELTEEAKAMAALARGEAGELARALVQNRGECYLPEAASYGHAVAVRALLDLGVPIGSRGMAGGTPLHQACWHGHAEVVDLLVERGAELNVLCEEYGSPPLGWAVHGAVNCGNPSGDYPRVIRRLIGAGADVTLPANSEGDSVFDLIEDREDLVEVLREAILARGV